MSDLSDALVALRGDRRQWDPVEAAARNGHRISLGQLSAFLSGRHGTPQESTLLALSAAFGVDVRVLRELAGWPAGELGPYVPAPEAASLSREQRAAIDGLIRSIVKAK